MWPITLSTPYQGEVIQLYMFSFCSRRGGIRTHTEQGLSLMPSSSWATRPFVIVLSSYNFNFVGRVGIEPTLEQINSLCEKDWIACWQITPIFDGLRKPTFQPPHMYLWAWRDSNSQNTCTSSMPVYHLRHKPILLCWRRDSNPHTFAFETKSSTSCDTSAFGE